MSLQQQQVEKQDFSDSAKPEKLCYEDLEAANEYQEDIPEQLASDVSHSSGNIVSGSHVPTTVPATVTSQQDTSGAEKATVLRDQKQPEEQQEKEEQKWENGSGDRKESRQRERQEALEVEQGALEKMKEEMCVQESFETEERKPNEDITHLEVSLLKSEDHDVSDSPNPLEKYMKMIQQNQEQELVNETSKREEVEEMSSERNLGSERENSVSAAGILHGEPDEDFW